jgi:hypothetical protein
MTEKKAKPKPKRQGSKATADPAKSVMGNLSSTRPTGMGRHRDGATPTAAPSGRRTAAKPPAAAPKTAATKTKGKAAPKAKAAPKPKPAAAKPRAAVKTVRAADGPQAVRSGAPSLERPTAKTAPPEPSHSRPLKGTELVTTAVEAAGELAQIGFTLGGQVVKRAVGRLPRR